MPALTAPPPHAHACTPRRSAPCSLPPPCAERHLQPWVLPALKAVVPHMHSRLTRGWGSLQAPAGEQAGGGRGERDVVVAQRVVCMPLCTPCRCMGSGSH